MERKQRIVIAGGSGLIGSACRTYFTQQGYDVVILTRREKRQVGEVHWDPEHRTITRNVIDGASAVLNLCGLSLADKRWSARYKEELLSSRVVPAQFLKSLIEEAKEAPTCYIGISGIGIYGNQGNQAIYDDSMLISRGFVPDLVQAWEHAHLEIPKSRNVILRTGVVLSAKGGFLEKLMLPSRFGMYPYFGNGRQVLSWISMDDLTSMILHCIRTSALSGICHATAPQGTAQRELVRAFKEVRKRPGIVFGVPELFLRIGLGEMASILFESADVRPDKIMRAGFQHKHADINSALQIALNPA